MIPKKNYFLNKTKQNKTNQTKQTKQNKQKKKKKKYIYIYKKKYI